MAQEIPRLPLHTWIVEGLRAAVLLPPRVLAAQPTALQLIALIVLASAIDVMLDRWVLGGEARFDTRGLLLSWWNAGAVVLLAWGLLPREPEDGGPRGVATWFALWIVALMPANTMVQLVQIAQAHEVLPDSELMSWLPTLTASVWLVAATLRLGTHFALRPALNIALTAGLAALFALTAWQFPDRPWQLDPSELAQQQKSGLELSQETFETQQALWVQVNANLAAQRRGVSDVYGIVFSPYADEEVFLRESTLVKKVLEERFDAAGRVIHLANHATTADSLPWATPRNLERAIDTVARKMDREHDVLVVYFTSHGASDFKLAASNPPLAVDTVSPGELRQALDNAGVRNRVILISACYSGGWVGPLADENTLVMTAADATHTSFGCGSRSELTFFGRAMFDEQLRHTHSFEQAFAAAVPVIRKREQEAHKEDGFSNPQISMGEKIRPVLRELEQRLDAGASK
ncbi:MAG TPA: C13 family peptidase [Ramlibacter sp.]|nr:C13 family peptidase [Ramlibacter sp.]